jgi:4-amino-4-deoxy-L-arabinose transferase-like glycosyltransferase
MPAPAFAAAGRFTWLALAGIMVGSAIATLVHLDALPVFDDEAIAVWYAHVAAHPHHLNDLFGAFDYSVPPLVIWFGALAQRLESNPLLAVRIVSALAGVAAIPALYVLAWKLYRSAATGLLAAALYALCPYELMFNRMALLDPLVQLWGLLIAIQSLRLFRDRRPLVPQAILIGVLLGLAQLSKGIALFFWLLPLLAWLVHDRHSVQRLFRSARIAIPIAVAEYSVILLSGNLRNLFRPFFTAIKYSVATPYPGYYASHSHVPLPSLIAHNGGQWVSWQQTYVGFPVLLSLAAALVFVLQSRNSSDHYLALWLVAPLAAMLCVKIYTSRYVLFTVPIELLLVSRVVVYGTTFMRNRPRARYGKLIVGLPLGAFAVAAALVIWFDVGQDAALIQNPAQASYVPDDRWQYIEGWSSGYGLATAERYVQARARTGTVGVVAEQRHQPINALLYAFAGDSHIRVFPESLARPVPARPVTQYAVLDSPKDSITSFETANPGWHVVLTVPKIGNQSTLLVMKSP